MPNGWKDRIGCVCIRLWVITNDHIWLSQQRVLCYGLLLGMFNRLTGDWHAAMCVCIRRLMRMLGRLQRQPLEVAKRVQELHSFDIDQEMVRSTRQSCSSALRSACFPFLGCSTFVQVSDLADIHTILHYSILNLNKVCLGGIFYSCLCFSLDLRYL